jgi:hypothetical protein
MHTSLPRQIAVVGLLLATGTLAASAAFADTAITVDNARQEASSVLDKIVSAYEARIRDLETENARLRAQLSALGASGAITGSGVAASSGATSTGVLANSVTVSSTGSIATLVITGNEALDKKYRAIMQKIQDNKDFVLRTNEMGTGASIGLFEFIEPDAFFISLDDGKNPAGQTAFRRKVLYKYDVSTYEMQVMGIFDFDFSVSKYVTKFGSNPHANSVRTKVKNPYYAGKLLETAPAVSTGTASVGTSTGKTSTGTTSTGSTTAVTVNAIKTAFFANKMDEAVKLCDTLLATDSSNVEVRKIRYRALYRLGRYADAMLEVEKVRVLQGTNFESGVACEAKVVAEKAGDATKRAEYAVICPDKN